ncbi:uncharacterized protein [Ptychodera flava]|uniref:uncharacterized protein n=1 Tax=Ptychodera flava TaxID=63121 RepID=UPI003969DB7A
MAESEGTERVFRCEYCKFRTFRESNIQRHRQSKRHKTLSRLCEWIVTSDDTATSTPICAETFEVDSYEDYDISDVCIPENIGVNDEEDNTNFDQCDENIWYPFPSKIFFLLYTLCHSGPRPMSRETKKFIWFILEELNVPDIPSIESVSQFSVPGFEDLIGKGTASDETPFTYIKPSALIKLLLGNPKIASCINRFPTYKDTLHHQCEGKKWQSEFPASHVKGYFAGDPVLLSNRETGIIKSFMKKVVNSMAGSTLKLHAVVHKTVLYNDPLLRPFSDILNERSLVPMRDSTMVVDVDDIVGISHPHDYQISHVLKLVNGDVYLEDITQDEELLFSPNTSRIPEVYLPINIYADDTSGNKSKQWNSYHVLSMQLAGLPTSEKDKLKNVHFVSTSNIVKPNELFQPIVDDIKSIRDGICTLDACTGKEAIFKPRIAIGIFDSVMGSKLSNHLGATANHPCRICDIDKSSLSHVGTPRTKATVKEIIKELEATEMESDRKRIRRESGIKEGDNCLLDIEDFSPYSDTPQDRLHAVLINPNKNLLSEIMAIMDENDKAILGLSMEEFDWTSFERRLTSKSMAHYGSFIGRHYKLWVQVAPFHLARCNSIPIGYIQAYCLLSEIAHLVYRPGPYLSEELEHLKLIIQQFISKLTEIGSALIRYKNFGVHTIRFLSVKMRNVLC